MKAWGLLVTLFYALVLVFLLLPGIGWLAVEDADFFTMNPVALPDSWPVWLWIALLIAAQLLLLLVAVDSSRQRLRRRTRLSISVAAAAIAAGLLSAAAIWSVLLGLWGDEALEIAVNLALTPLTFWLIWGVVFYIYRERISDHFEKTLGWLIKGSVLELLIAVPSHVVARQREDCCAPGLTAWGIATGIAVMLMAFGPSVILLYQKRIREFDKRSSK